MGIHHELKQCRVYPNEEGKRFCRTNRVAVLVAGLTFVAGCNNTNTSMSGSGGIAFIREATRNYGPDTSGDGVPDEVLTAMFRFSESV
ncbi:MAG: hypothetical protein GKR96_00220 [Gammaproteobacteria bacterium]|nr:hypothetical protein [Gammaproteobacteria bacterium]